MRLNILVVDDDKVLRGELSKWLEREGHNVKSAGSGEEAIEMVKNGDFKLIFTDLKMPGISGLDVLKALRQLSSNVHMVMITAYGTIDTAVEAMKNGADDYIMKPFKMEQLQTVIENLSKTIEFKKQINLMTFPEKTKYGDPYELLATLVQYNNGLCITQMNPHGIKEKYDLQNISMVWLTPDKNCESCINPKNIYDLKLMVTSFLKENPHGIVLLDGLEILIEHHSWDVVKKFISYIIDETLHKPSHLIIPVKANQIDDRTVTELKRLLSYPYIHQISEAFANPIRREIVRFLFIHDSMNFTGIQKELKIKDPPKLSFHLKRLMNDGILQKDKKEGYFLTKKGESAAEHLLSLENEVLIDFQKNISLILS